MRGRVGCLFCTAERLPAFAGPVAHLSVSFCSRRHTVALLIIAAFSPHVNVFLARNSIPVAASIVPAVAGVPGVGVQAAQLAAAIVLYAVASPED
jgi:hypothetical protein